LSPLSNNNNSNIYKPKTPIKTMENKEILPSIIKHKKKIFLVLTLIKIPLLIYIISILVTVPAITAINTEYNTIKGAHRGDSVENFENTLEAIKNATENQEYNFIEFDIQYTKDKQRILFHDISLLRTTGNSESIENLTYNELQELTSFNIPTYKQAMDTIENKKKINIEIKSQGNFEDDKELLDFTIQDCKQRGIINNIMISSVSREVIEYSKQKYPEIKTGKIYWILSSTYLPFDFLTENLYQDINEMQADYIMLHGANINNMSDLIEQKPKDKTLCFWYFNNEMYILQKDNTDGMW